MKDRTNVTSQGIRSIPTSQLANVVNVVSVVNVINIANVVNVVCHSVESTQFQKKDTMKNVENECKKKKTTIARQNTKNQNAKIIRQVVEEEKRKEKEKKKWEKNKTKRRMNIIIEAQKEEQHLG